MFLRERRRTVALVGAAFLVLCLCVALAAGVAGGYGSTARDLPRVVTSRATSAESTGTTASPVPSAAATPTAPVSADDPKAARGGGSRPAGNAAATASRNAQGRELVEPTVHERDAEHEGGEGD